MTYDLYIGDRTFSTWSLRGWLMFEKFGIPHRSNLVEIYRKDGTAAPSDDLIGRLDGLGLAPARLLPVMRGPDGVVIGDSLAMAETLAERFPEAGHWPDDPAARGLARWAVAEMHSGFAALREECSMQLLHLIEGFAPSEATRADLVRIEEIWTLARTRHGGGGPWLFGAYSLADAFYAPVAARIAGYGLPAGDLARAYVETTLSDTAFRQWRAMGLAKPYDRHPYDTGLPTGPWPGPSARPAQAVAQGTPENAACPYSGDPAEFLMQTDGQVFGFCNAFCRDKTVADPDAWPAFTALRDAE